jgi:hypothetical protein
MPRLLLNFGTPQEYQFQLNPGINLAGRSAANQIGIEHPSITEPHCELDLLQDGTVRVRDLGSISGTFIDSLPMQQGILRSGQVLRIGDVELLFDGDTPADLIIIEPALRVPDPVVPAPAPTTAPPPAVPEGPVICNNHPKSQAKLQCQQCGRLFCDLCVSTKRAGGAQRKFCRDCGGECNWLSAWLLLPQRDERSFYQLLPSAFAYPFQGDGVILMIAGTLFYLFVEFVARAPAFAIMGKGAVLVVFIFAYGYLFAYQMRIIASTIEGRDQMPDWPDFTGFEDVARPFIQVLVTVIACVVPGLVSLVVFKEQDWGWAVAVAFFSLGAIYLPMAFLAVSLFDALEVLNPLFIFPSILRVLREYLVAFGVLAGGVVFNILINFVLERFIPATHLGVAVLSGLLSGFVGFYLLTVEMRILGILYRTQQDDLGWFRH